MKTYSKLTMILVLLLAVQVMAGQYEKLKEESFSVSPGGKLLVETDIGNVEVTGWDNDEVVVVLLGNDKTEDYFEVEITGSRDRVKVKAEKINDDWDNDVKIAFEIKVPAKYTVELSTAAGNLALENVDGRNVLNTAAGNMMISSCAGNLETNTAGGNVKIAGFDGEIEINTAGGNIHAEDFTGPIAASTAGGNISLEGGGGKVKARTGGGNISLKLLGENQGVNLKTGAGQISMELPSDVKGNVHIESGIGDVDCDFKLSNTKISSHRNEISGNINGGGPEIRAQTGAGSVRIAD